MKNRNDNILVYIACADAYSKKLEFNYGQKLKEDALMFYRYGYLHPAFESLTHGNYNDSTQMNLAMANWLSHSLYGGNLTEEGAATAMVMTYQGDARSGYQFGFADVLRTSFNGKDFLSKIKKDSIKNGACTRSVVLGVVKDPLEVMRLAEIQAKTTHDTPDGILSSKAIALMSHYALWGDKPLHEVGKYLSLFLPEFTPEKFAPLNGPLNSPRLGMQTAAYVHDILSTEYSLIGMMNKIIKISGDLDNLSSIVWGIACCRFQDEKLPEFFFKDLEDGKYGKGYLEIVGKSLMEKFDK